MGMFGFLKKRKVEVEVESVAFGEIEGWTGDKEVLLLKDEGKVLGEIEEKLDGFYVSIEERLGVLEGIDIEGKKEHERAKILVRQGLDKYIIAVRILLKDLDNLGMNHLGKFGVEVAEAFNHFERTSAKFYGRANYLIGDEMAAVRNEIRRFYNGLAELLEGSSVKDLRRVENIKRGLGEIEKVENNYREIEKEIRANDLKIDKAKNEVKRLEDEIEEIKGSREYVSGIKLREEIKGLRVQLDKEIGKLKELIDFKRLTNLVHSNEGEMGIVKDFKAHFVSEFSRDRERLLGLLSGCNMRSDKIWAQTDSIRGKEDELGEKNDGVGIDYTVKKLNDIGKLNESIENLELESIKNDRRLEELDLKLKGLRNEVVLLIEEFGVRVKV